MPLPVRRNREETSRFDPFNELRRVQDQLSGYLDRWNTTAGLFEGAFTPLADVEETDDAWVAEIELPGVDKDDVDIEVSGSRLTVSGERREKQRSGTLRRRTRTVGQFHFELSVPDDIDADKVEASLDHGVLSVRLPKPAGAAPRRVKVN
ncbi:MAG: Hsp20/alpha crystallin family protein [Acidimicrobiales bacterium]